MQAHIYKIEVWRGEPYLLPAVLFVFMVLEIV
jgi:hypothetical protein